MPVKTDVHFQSPFIQSTAVDRPQPDTPAPNVEYESIRDIPKEATHGVGFSAGNDSLVATHKAMSEGHADFVVHIDTGTNLTESISYVREVCDKYGWPLIIAPTTEGTERYFCRYGAPDQSGHTSAFHTLKGRGLRAIANHVDGEFVLITGVYQRESQNRMENVDGEYSNPDYCAWAYSSILWNWSERDFREYMETHNLPKSPTKQKIHRSGDCQCLAFGHRDEIFVDIEAHYPEDFAFLKNIERRMQEYRGRLLRIEDEYPEVYRMARDSWCEETPDQSKLTLDVAIQRNNHEVFEWATDLSREGAIRRGRQVASNYLGYGGLSDAEEHGLVKRAEIADGKQADLCEYCESMQPTEPKTVQRAVEKAREN